MTDDGHRASVPALTSLLRRREALLAVGVAGLVGAGLTACSQQESQHAVGGAAKSLMSQADSAAIPVGGGTIIDSAKVVITRPAATEFKAFSSICTHQGCLVTRVSDGVIVCPCHGSKFDITTGEVKQGPATEPLPEKTISIDGSGVHVS